MSIFSHKPELFHEPEHAKLESWTPPTESDEVTLDGVKLTDGDKIREFWNSRFWGLRFGQLYKLGGRTYRSYGLDVVHPTHTAIPTWASGRVHLITYSSVIGHVVTIETSKKHFVTYAHVTNIQVKVGQQIEHGHTIAYVAGPGDAHGSAWTGPHVVVHEGNTLASWYGIGCFNPVTGIEANIRTVK